MSYPDRLSVIALISGGKDSFFSALHCLSHDHNIVALANLMPADDADQDGVEPQVQIFDPSAQQDAPPQNPGAGVNDDETDLNSFMYQTVGHEVIPLYAAATGIPLYRRAISGGAVRHERDYDSAAAVDAGGDETESMIPLLRFILERHPEANAICSGAILSTYQRTRVESVATRLGLTSLAYLWKYPVLPAPDPTMSGRPDLPPAQDTQLLLDMAAAGLDARIIKVASAGLDEDFLWEQVSSDHGAYRVKRALSKFGGDSGASVLGEGGEFETLVVDGPKQLFQAQKKIVVPEQQRRVVREGGGSAWLMLRGARLEALDTPSYDKKPRMPDDFDNKFLAAYGHLMYSPVKPKDSSGLGVRSSLLGKSPALSNTTEHEPLQWAVMARNNSQESTVESETVSLVASIRQLLASRSLEPSQISNTIIVLRQMSDFAIVNGEYAKLFTKPNPPSRVTISCGHLLPEGTRIGIYLTVDPTPVPIADRKALHVQSRSYWAPANIGPYSQAVGTPIRSPEGETTKLRSWSVAGQIPLVSSYMMLPDTGTRRTPYPVQITLSLQHLWRIGLDMRVQFWTSAVAFFARHDYQPMRKCAQMAGQAWHLAHGSPEHYDDDNDNNMDPWDRKYNAVHLTLAAGDASSSQPTMLPDWSVLTLRQRNEPTTCIPPVFSVEVDGLPKGSLVEWHAHTGLSNLGMASLEVLYSAGLEEPQWKGWNVVARGEGAAFIHSVLSRGAKKGSGSMSFESLQRDLARMHDESLKGVGLANSGSPSARPYLLYIDPKYVKGAWSQPDETETSPALPIIPCLSIWSCGGDRLACIALYKTTVS